MKSCITKHGLGSFRAPVIQVKVVFPGEAHASVNLDSAIAHRAARVARVKLGDGNSSGGIRSEEHTSELQSHSDLVCRLLLEKKKQLHARQVPPCKDTAGGPITTG